MLVNLLSSTTVLPHKMKCLEYWWWSTSNKSSCDFIVEKKFWRRIGYTICVANELCVSIYYFNLFSYNCFFAFPVTNSSSLLNKIFKFLLIYYLSKTNIFTLSILVSFNFYLYYFVKYLFSLKEENVFMSVFSLLLMFSQPSGGERPAKDTDNCSCGWNSSSRTALKWPSNVTRNRVQVCSDWGFTQQQLHNTEFGHLNSCVLCMHVVFCLMYYVFTRKLLNILTYSTVQGQYFLVEKAKLKNCNSLFLVQLNCYNSLKL